SVPYLSYFSNYTYFSEEVCINKLNPELDCNGKCQLKKMVEKQHNHNDSAPDDAIHLIKSSSTIFFFERIQKTDIRLRSTQHKYCDISIANSPPVNLPATPPPRLG